MSYPNYDTKNYYDIAKTIDNAAPGSKSNQGLAQVNAELGSVIAKIEATRKLIIQQAQKNGKVSEEETEKIIAMKIEPLENQKRALLEKLTGFTELSKSNAESSLEQRKRLQDKLFESMQKNASLLTFDLYQGSLDNWQIAQP
jgi:hypothetical protein